MSLNVSGENSGTKGQTGTKEQGQRQGYSLPPYVFSTTRLKVPDAENPDKFFAGDVGSMAGKKTMPGTEKHATNY